MTKLKERFFAVPDGEVHPRWFEPGERVSGQVAQYARDAGVAAQEPAPAKTRKAPRNAKQSVPETRG